jgi:hypothetical protein
MKLDFIPEGSSDCPLVRLYDFDRKEAADFKSLLEQLRDGRKEIKVHDRLSSSRCEIADSHSRMPPVIWAS